MGGIGGMLGIGGHQGNVGGGGSPFDLSKFVNNVPMNSIK